MSKTIKFSIKLLIDGKEQLTTATATVTRMRQAMDQAQGSAQQFRDGLISVNQAVATLQNASAAISSLRDKMAGLTATYSAVQQANTQLTTVMRQRMDATDQEIKSITDVISAQSKLGVVSGTVQKSGAQQVATFLKEKESLSVLIPAMNDLIAQQKGVNSTQEDARGVANLMGKAMQGQTSALRRVGITFDEAQEKVMKYGTEQQRAAMLAQIITDNVGHMNAELGKTDAGKLKHAEANFAAIKVKIGELVSSWLPQVTMVAQSLTVVNSVIALGKSIQGVTSIIGVFNGATSVMGAVCGTVRSSFVGITAIVKSLQMVFTGATVGATTLRIALSALLKATGVGLAIWALCEGISFLSSGSDKAASSVDNLTQAQLEAKQAHERLTSQIAQQTSTLDINIQKLKNFCGNKADEKKLVDEMNTTYGSTMGYYSSVAQWYTALTANSKAYCQQMINEINIRDLANQIAKEQQTRNAIMYDENGKTRKYSKKRKQKAEKYEIYHGGYVDRGYRNVDVVGSSDQEKASAAATASYRREQEKRKRMEALVKKNQSISFAQTEGYSATAPAATVLPSSSSTTPKAASSVTAKEKPALRGSMDWYEEEIQKKRKERDASNDDAKTASLNSEMEGLQRSLYMLKVKVGIETPPGADIQKELKPMTETVLESFDDLQQRIKDNPIQVETDPDGLEKMRKKMSDLENIQMLGNTNLQSLESVKTSLKSITDITNPTEKGLAAAGEACSTLGGAMQQLGADSEAAKAGMVIAAVGQIVLSFAQALASCKTWVEWLAFGISGTAQMISLISTVSGFATGGIVGGSSTTGDKIPIRVNSGEMVLNKTQQARLFALADGKERPKMTLPDYRMSKMTLNTAALSEMNRQNTQSQTVRFKIDGRNLVGALANETRISSRSGRRSNIQI